MIGRMKLRNHLELSPNDLFSCATVQLTMFGDLNKKISNKSLKASISQPVQTWQLCTFSSSFRLSSSSFSSLQRSWPRIPQVFQSMDWFKGKFTGKPWFLPSNIGLSCKFSHHPILWFKEKNLLKAAGSGISSILQDCSLVFFCPRKVQMAVRTRNNWLKCPSGWWCNVPILKNMSSSMGLGWHPMYHWK